MGCFNDAREGRCAGVRRCESRWRRRVTFGGATATLGRGPAGELSTNGAGLLIARRFGPVSGRVAWQTKRSKEKLARDGAGADGRRRPRAEVVGRARGGAAGEGVPACPSHKESHPHSPSRASAQGAGGQQQGHRQTYDRDGRVLREEGRRPGSLFGRGCLLPPPAPGRRLWATTGCLLRPRPSTPRRTHPTCPLPRNLPASTRTVASASSSLLPRPAVFPVPLSCQPCAPRSGSAFGRSPSRRPSTSTRRSSAQRRSRASSTLRSRAGGSSSSFTRTTSGVRACGQSGLPLCRLRRRLSGLQLAGSPAGQQPRTAPSPLQRALG